MKKYRIIKEGAFKKPFDKKGLLINLNNRRAADFIAKGFIEDPAKPVKEPKSSPKKASNTKAPTKAKESKESNKTE